MSFIAADPNNMTAFHRFRRRDGSEYEVECSLADNAALAEPGAGQPRPPEGCTWVGSWKTALQYGTYLDLGDGTIAYREAGGDLPMFIDSQSFQRGDLSNARSTK